MSDTNGEGSSANSPNNQLPRPLRQVLSRGGVQRRGIRRTFQISHVAIPEAPVYPDRSSPVHTRHRIQFTPEQVDEFLQSLPRVKSSSMSKEEQRCEICSFEYGEVRGILAAPVPGKGKTRMSVPEVEEGLPGEELPELAAKLPCGHIYGEWCIKTWLLERPATCPTCRHCFQPV